MDVRQLEYAVRLAETLHFGKAAASAYISQPAFSVQIARLESELGCTLFERSNHRVALTSAGQHFVERAQQILSQIYMTAYETRSIFEKRQAIRIGYFGEGAGELTHLIFESFRMISPQTEIHLRELTMRDQVKSLIENEVDVALLRTPVIDSRVELTPLFQEPLVAVVSQYNPLSDAEKLTTSDLLDQPFAVAAEGTPREWAAFWSLDEDRGSASRVGGTVNTILESLSTVAYCNAVDTFPASATRLFSHPGVKYVELEDAPSSELSIARISNSDNAYTDVLIERAYDITSQMFSLLKGAKLPDSRS